MVAGLDPLTPGLSMSRAIEATPATPTGRPSRRRWAWLGLVLVSLASVTPAPTPHLPISPDLPISGVTRATNREPITSIPPAPAADPRKLALGEQLFQDRRL